MSLPDHLPEEVLARIVARQRQAAANAGKPDPHPNYEQEAADRAAQAEIEATKAANRAALEGKLRAGFAKNVEHGGKTNPSAPENAAQIKALSAQVNALTLLVLDTLDSTDGT